ncbi:Co-chaperone Hsc20 [Astrocystis sublimbata]|nr:Co-chaperone Hsc20 [Astrocystis sublimbata]
MRLSIRPQRLTSRLCTFCPQQRQRQQGIAATRNIHASSIHRREQHARTSAARRPSPRAPKPSAPQTHYVHLPKTLPTHYEFFPETLPDGPPPRGRFRIDVRALRREFLRLQAGAHPDLHPPEMKARAQATSARINEAFTTLENPLLRAQYLLSLRGCDVAGDETAKVEDPELLMLVLETRESIEEAEDEADLEGPRLENEARIADAVDVLQELFAQDDLEAAKPVIVQLRYWVNIRESMNNWEKGKPIVLEH